MNKTITNQYFPDVIPAPGETLTELLEEHHLSPSTLAEQLQEPESTIERILNGSGHLTPEIALNLEKIFKISAHFWGSNEQRYQEYLQRRRNDEWFSKVPYGEMCKNGWIKKVKDKIEQQKIILEFFNVVSPEHHFQTWQSKEMAFRKSVAFQSDHIATLAWLRKGEIDAENMCCQKYSRENFEIAIQKARELTKQEFKQSIGKLIDLCSGAGISLVFVKPLKGVRASGVMRWLTPNKGLIQMSLRYKKNDHFWFTFFHEACHVLQEEKSSVFVEPESRKDYDPQDPLEQEANTYAANILIPPDAYKEFTSNRRRFKNEDIKAFAESIGIAPGIVVGRLQHDEKIPPNQGNHLRQNIDWQEITKDIK